MKEFEIDEPRHYYCITFKHNVENVVTYTNVYVSVTKKRITKNFLEEIIHTHKLVDEIVISISYMGYMTEEEFLYE